MGVFLSPLLEEERKCNTAINIIEFTLELVNGVVGGISSEHLEKWFIVRVGNDVGTWKCFLGE